MALHVSPTRRWSALAVALLVAAGTLTACGDDDGGSSATTATTATGAAGGATAPATTPAGSATTRLAIVAEERGGLSWSRRTLTARAGDVTIALDNPSGNQLPHAVEIEGNGVERESATIEPGAVTDVSANLRPGTYTFYCPVDGHRQQGMEGTLTVG
ncbi:cupredoxin domain-containing protein [Conexibacter woesei]|uniref:Blue (Type 1) copper domain protein n=1 Tax=Conexibacter woesei (strain DSM 14684 / CCUG 47730 / CIP 108061 / JCM 11494 / NBRC 100937 / ID131577) TaxID=469383 RepID=D3FCU8_CONWI|nr:cupredoxin domain-containing protein [Conexibacter woesei]ADB51460.1 blue (type 1) copper domain protein [Conexibacter woesei DSM 14684]